MGRKEFNKILRRYSEGKCTPEEKALVQKWYDAIGRDIQFSLNEERSEKLERELWNKLSFRIHNDDSVEQRTASTVWNWKTARIAASVLLLVGILSYVALGTFNSKTPSVAINASETVITNHDVFDKLVQLEDGSQITLKPKSEVSFARHFLKEKREIKLTGEAFFEVAHDEQRPFIVYTRNVITRVLGTSFLVQAAESNPAVVVSVKTGRVSVSREAKEFFGMRKTIREEAILIPNQKVIIDDNDNKVMKMLVDDPQPLAAAQKMKMMKFEEEPVPAILQALEKTYGVEILFDKTLLKSCALTTVLTEEGLYERLNIICKAIDGTYEIQGTKIILKSNGCNN